MESFLKVKASVPKVVSGKKNAATRIQIVNHCIIWSILCKISHFWYIVNIAVMMLLSVKRNILHGWGHKGILWKSCKGHVLCGLEGCKYVTWSWALADMFKTDMMAGHFSFLHAHTYAHVHARTRTYTHTYARAHTRTHRQTDTKLFWVRQERSPL